MLVWQVFMFDFLAQQSVTWHPKTFYSRNMHKASVMIITGPIMSSLCPISASSFFFF